MHIGVHFVKVLLQLKASRRRIISGAKPQKKLLHLLFEVFELDFLFFNSVVASLDPLVEGHLQLFKVVSEFAGLIFDSITCGACDE